MPALQAAKQLSWVNISVILHLPVVLYQALAP